MCQQLLDYNPASLVLLKKLRLSVKIESYIEISQVVTAERMQPPYYLGYSHLYCSCTNSHLLIVARKC